MSKWDGCPIIACKNDLCHTGCQYLDPLATLRAVVAHFDGTDAPLGERARAVLAKAEGKP